MVTTQIDGLLTIKEVREVVRLGRSTIYREMDAGRFPRPLTLGARSVRWRAADIRQWIADGPKRTATSMQAPSEDELANLAVGR
ncbi:helix-turn-helix transcriptional regulator [Microbaculum marinum]|uniref:AlpA family phage regulatory protein n=1 Tax=Microbaculum marinum TaxID=1764581 RepID=A0AAW9RV08_9HYPH